MARPLEVMFVLIVGIVLAPVLFAVAIFVRSTLGSPVFFGQTRSGMNGQSFRMLKFRTMTNGTDAAGQSLPDRDRTPAAGRFLRRSRLDELPELFNILLGEMALIGPRPLLPNTIAEMGSAGLQRGRVRPGLTGWAQVNGNAKLSQKQKYSLDLWYIDNRSLGLDVEILIRTIHVVIGGERINLANLEKAIASCPYRRC